MTLCTPPPPLVSSTSSLHLSHLHSLHHRYINHLCEVSDSSFVCSLCGRSTELKSLTVWHNQYCRYPAARQHLPELQQQVYEVIVDPDPQDGAAAAAMQQVRACVLSVCCQARDRGLVGWGCCSICGHALEGCCSSSEHGSSSSAAVACTGRCVCAEWHCQARHRGLHSGVGLLRNVRTGS